MRLHAPAAPLTVLLAVMMFIVATFGTVVAFNPPAAAETVTKSDPQARCSQAPSLDVKRAKFTYGESVFKVRIKMGALSKKRTQVFARFTVGTRASDSYGVQLVSKFKGGQVKTVGYWSDYQAGDYANRFTRGLAGRWDWNKRVVTFDLREHLRGRHVSASAYSVAKGALHGPPCGDYISLRRLNRG